jgi:hypothetical protein
MSPTVVGTLVGILVSAFCSLVGVVIARVLGGDYTTLAILVHAAAAIVLLVNILARMEARS